MILWGSDSTCVMILSCKRICLFAFWHEELLGVLCWQLSKSRNRFAGEGVELKPMEKAILSYLVRKNPKRKKKVFSVSSSQWLLLALHTKNNLMLKEGEEWSEIMSVRLFHMQTFFGHLGTICLWILPLFLSYFLHLCALSINWMRCVSETVCIKWCYLILSISWRAGLAVACWGALSMKTIFYLPTFVQIVNPVKEVFRF